MSANIDLKNRLRVSNALNGASITSNTTTNGEWIDTTNLKNIVFAIRSSARTDGTFTPSISVANEDDKSDAAAVSTDALIGTYAGAAISAANSVKTIGVAGVKAKYLRLNIVSTSVTTGGHLSALAIGESLSQPVA